MNRSRKLGLMLAAAGLMAGCGADANQEPETPPPPMTVKTGWVYVWDHDGNAVAKRCDDTTLVYYVPRGLTSVPNSPECK